jgi:hypothetical protein
VEKYEKWFQAENERCTVYVMAESISQTLIRIDPIRDNIEECFSVMALSEFMDLPQHLVQVKKNVWAIPEIAEKLCGIASGLTC